VTSATEIWQESAAVAEEALPPIATAHSRGWLVRRALLAADVFGLVVGFGIAEIIFGDGGPGSTRNHYAMGVEVLLFLLTLPVWIFMAKLYGLYGRDEERTDHSTIDELTGVFHLVTVGTWFVYAAARLTGVADPGLVKMFAFSVLAILLVTSARAVARALSRLNHSYIQNTIILGAGDVGQLIGRKLLQHPEYGIRVLGFVDSQPRERRSDIRDLALLGELDELPRIVEGLGVRWAIVAFSNEPHHRLLDHARSLRKLGVQVDLVPWLFEAVGPRVELHTVEGVPLLGLPPVRPARVSLAIKRALDIVVSGTMLLALMPVFAYLALRIRRDSPGPIFFRQTRLGVNMREFTLLKFRTMHADTDPAIHRERVAISMSSTTAVGEGGSYKAESLATVTRFGRWLRRSSLDELPQLFNILRGDMSLVGPRPCIPYETQHFKPHQFDRFDVPQGLTGLWQVTARSRATFGEALEMDVAYARSWSLWLDLRLLLRTPLTVLRQRGAV
jgi:exopolysaccharide biosynthesis polyprenyl glycosylphosphotransferase